jgi:hypothetical protein
MIKIQMGNVGPDEDQVTSGEIGQMASHMPFTVGPFNIDEFKLRMKMPKEEIVQLGVVQQVERAFFIGLYIFELNFHLIT